MLIVPFIIFFAAVNLFAQSPHGKNLLYDCSYCHVSATWDVDLDKIRFNHNETEFKLAGQHKIVDCKSCHVPEYSDPEIGSSKILSLTFSNERRECFSCHKDVHRNTLGSDCESCHTPESWGVKNINQIHQLSRFPLAGAHLSADCIDCHSGFNNLIFEPLDVLCISCHEQDYRQTTFPNHITAGFSTDCQLCHDPAAFEWGADNFAHSFFPLTGGHNIQNCFSCHQRKSFEGLSASCVSCHLQDYQAVKDPDHVAAGFSMDCAECHSINAFIPASFNHALTDFPLTGAHINTNCSSCHSQQYTGTPQECVSCHQQDYNVSTNPPHRTLQLSTDCTGCHTTTPAWMPASFPVHNNFYILLGAHTAIQNDCASCHNGNYVSTPETCYGCHQQDYNQAVNPPHQGAGFSTDCETCHSQNAWRPSTFNHDQQYFPIFSGEHDDVWETCADCHTNSNNFSVFSCITCHEHNQLAMLEVHIGMTGYVYESNSCFACHPNGEKEGAFDHSVTQFPLTGAHASLNCIQCHQDGFSSISTECLSCHETDYNNSLNPNHISIGMPTTCNDCHSAAAWIPSGFVHSNTGFALLGGHNIDCSSCHTGITSGTNSACISCHQNNFNAAPNHIAQRYPIDCTICHNAVSWNQTTFNHQATAFPLTGAHTAVDCSGCHESGFAGTPIHCASCHQQDYNASTNPDHEALQLPADCSQCHNINPGWQPAAFPLHDNYFQLIGAHAAIKNDCSTCHNGNYITTPDDCYGCHQEDYNSTLNPPHLLVLFPKECEECHSQTSWQPASFNHDEQYFPIYSGKHRNEWNSCSDCHTNQNNFSAFSCIDCHEHNQTDMDDEHREVSGYAYSSQQCFSCHPDGSEGPLRSMMKRD